MGLYQNEIMRRDLTFFIGYERERESSSCVNLCEIHRVLLSGF